LFHRRLFFNIVCKDTYFFEQTIIIKRKKSFEIKIIYFEESIVTLLATTNLRNQQEQFSWSHLWRDRWPFHSVCSSIFP